MYGLDCRRDNRLARSLFAERRITMRRAALLVFLLVLGFPQAQLRADDGNDAADGSLLGNDDCRRW
jgi:hypothetical protein